MVRCGPFLTASRRHHNPDLRLSLTGVQSCPNPRSFPCQWPRRTRSTRSLRNGTDTARTEDGETGFPERFLEHALLDAREPEADAHHHRTRRVFTVEVRTLWEVAEKSNPDELCSGNGLVSYYINLILEGRPPGIFVCRNAHICA